MLGFDGNHPLRLSCRPLYLACVWLGGLGGLSALRADDKVAAAPPPVARFEIEEHRNIEYRKLEKGEFISIENRLDLYLPKGLKGFPVVFLVHGGAWVGGDKQFVFMPSIARCFASQGLGVVSVNYRLYPWARYPSPIVEVAKAFAWTQEHIGNYGGRTDEIFLVGHSAGGHLVSLLATDEKYLRQEGADPGRIPGVIAVSGVYILSDVCLRICMNSKKVHGELSLTANPYKLIFGKESAAQSQVSPLSHLHSGLPPFLLIHAEHELPTLTQMALLFEAALREQGCDVQLYKAFDRNHVTEWWKARQPDDPVVRTIVEFIRAHRREKRMKDETD
jgi:acetyl esterase/lipase